MLPAGSGATAPSSAASARLSGAGMRPRARLQRAAPDMAVVAAEQLVAGIARQRHGDMLPRQRATRWVGICEESANGSSYIRGRRGMTSIAVLRIDIEFGMRRAEMRGDLARVVGLVVRALRKADA